MKAEKENIYTWNNYLSVLFFLKTNTSEATVTQICVCYNIKSLH